MCESKLTPYIRPYCFCTSAGLTPRCGRTSGTSGRRPLALADTSNTPTPPEGSPVYSSRTSSSGGGVGAWEEVATTTSLTKEANATPHTSFLSRGGSPGYLARTRSSGCGVWGWEEETRATPRASFSSCHRDRYVGAVSLSLQIRSSSRGAGGEGQTEGEAERQRERERERERRWGGRAVCAQFY